MATPQWFTLGMFSLMRGSIDLDNDTIKLMLTSGTFVPAQATMQYRADATSSESAITGGGTGGYTAGGYTLTGLTVGAAHPTVSWDAADLSQGIGGTLAFRYGVYYKSRGGAASADELIGYVDFGAGGTQTVINATVNITQTNQLGVTVS